MGWLQKILEVDKELFLFLNGFYSPFWDTIMLMITRKETWIPFFATIIYFFVKNYRVKAILILFFMSLVILFSDQFSVLLKENIQRLRPVYQPEIEHLVHNVLRKGGLYGFVSSHAANSFAIFAFTTRIFRNRTYWFLLLFWAVIFSYSRIYSGVHYPLDILGGAFLGWSIGVLLYKVLVFAENRFWTEKQPLIAIIKLQKRESGIVLLVFAVLLTTVFIVTSILHHYGYL
jgi:undecaprenyl-diphosphatase